LEASKLTIKYNKLRYRLRQVSSTQFNLIWASTSSKGLNYVSPRNTYRGSITVRLTSRLTGLEVCLYAVENSVHQV